MSDSIKIARLFGIDIELHWTFILLLLIVAFGGLLFFILILSLFICVLLHELAHSITSKRNKIKVNKIVLLPIGGISVIDTINIKPRVSFKIALAGPLASIVLGLFFGLITLITPKGIVTYFFQSLFILNILLGIFNLLPAYPMDGSRILKSYLEEKSNEEYATRKTIRISKMLIYGIGVFTIIYAILINTSLDNKTFIIFYDFIILFFLYGATKSEEELLNLKKITKNISIERLVSKNFIIVKKISLERLYKILVRYGPHYYIIKRDHGYKIILIARNNNIELKPIKEIPYNRGVVDTLIDLSDYGIGIVTKGHKPIGIVTAQHIETFLSLHEMRYKRKFINNR